MDRIREHWRSCSWAYRLIPVIALAFSLSGTLFLVDKSLGWIVCCNLASLVLLVASVPLLPHSGWLLVHNTAALLSTLYIDVDYGFYHLINLAATEWFFGYCVAFAEWLVLSGSPGGVPLG